MKLKDIEKSIRKEGDSVRVPDVFAKVRRAPINRLLTGETPIQAFEKKLATRLLGAVTVLILVIAICSAVIWASSPAEQGMGQGYVSVSVENGGIESRYAFVLTPSGSVLYAVEETSDYDATELAPLTGKTPENAIRDLYQSKSGDKVTICVYYASKDDARTLAVYLGDVLSENYESNMQKTISCLSNVASEKQHLADFANANVESAQLTKESDIAVLIEHYCLALSNCL